MKRYHSYSSTGYDLSDYGIVPINPNIKPNDVIQEGPPKPSNSPPTPKNDYSKLADWWFSTAGNSKIKADNKETVGIAPAAKRNTPYTNATLNNTDDTSGGGDNSLLQRYLPYIVAGGAVLMLVMMMFSTMM